MYINKLETVMTDIGEKAVVASRRLAGLDTTIKNRCLESIALSLERNSSKIFEENFKDVNIAKTSSKPASFIDRLSLNDSRFDSIINGIRQIISLEDPVGRILEINKRPNGLEIKKISVPIGVVGIIYESRPNVTIDSACLNIKTGNAVILRCGSESINTSIAMMNAIKEGCLNAGVEQSCVQLIPV